MTSRKTSAALRAERHPHADLMRALHDEERHHAVDSDGSQHERDRGKDSDQDDRKPPRRDRIGGDLLERPHIRGGKIGIEPADLAANRGGKRARILRAPHGQDHAAIRGLIMREVILRLRIEIEAAMPHIAHDARRW